MKRKLALVMEKPINFDNDLSTGVCFYKIYNKSKYNNIIIMSMVLI